MNLRCILFFVLLACSAGSAAAQSLKNFCASAKASFDHDYDLSAAVSAVFPDSHFAARDDDCLYPVKVLRYGDADVLIVTSNKPGEACHGCGVIMSAYVLRRAPGKSRVVARFTDFGSSGTFGDPGRIDAMQLAGHDAFAIESGGTFQGYTSQSVTFYIFKDRRLVELKPSLPLSADNGGAATDARQAISVDGAWRVEVGPTSSIAIDYKIRSRSGKRNAHAVWGLKSDSFILKAGTVPEEYRAAGGG